MCVDCVNIDSFTLDSWQGEEELSTPMHTSLASRYSPKKDEDRSV